MFYGPATSTDLKKKKKRFYLSRFETETYFKGI